MRHTQFRITVRLLLLGPLAGTLLVAGCAAHEPLSPHAETASAAATDEAPVRKVADDVFASGQPAPSQWASIRARGVTTVINLRPDQEMGGRDEASEVNAAGMRYRQLGIEGAEGVTDANAARIQSWIDEAPGPVLLHCSSGNRAGAMLAVIAARNGMPPAEALELGRRAGLTGLESTVRDLLAPADTETH